MQLTKAWKESLYLFRPSHFKLFLLVNIKSIYEVYKMILCYFWPLLSALILFHLYSEHAFFKTSRFIFLEFMLQQLFIFLIFCMIRSSITKKTFSYFVRKFAYMVPFLFITVVVYFFNYLILFKMNKIPALLLTFIISFFSGTVGWFALLWIRDIQQSVKLISPIKFTIYSQLGSIWLIPLSIFCAMFMLDSDGRIKSLACSLYRAFLMVYFNCPAILIISLFTILSYGLILFCILLSPVALWVPWGLMLSPISISIFANFYIKYVHSQFPLYFGKSNNH